MLGRQQQLDECQIMSQAIMTAFKMGYHCSKARQGRMNYESIWQLHYLEIKCVKSPITFFVSITCSFPYTVLPNTFLIRSANDPPSVLVLIVMGTFTSISRQFLLGRHHIWRVAINADGMRKQRSYRVHM